MSWALRYAPHVGYIPHDRRPLFRALAGTAAADHVRFAASQGMAGVLDPWAADRPLAQLNEIKEALEETGLVAGCVVSTPLTRLMEPLWVTEAGEAEVLGHLNRSLQVAADLGSKILAVLLVSDGETTPLVQRRRAVDRLRLAADIASKRGVTLGIEPIGTLPGMLLTRFADAVELVRAAGHPGIKLIFDTGHVTDMGEPLLKTYVEAYDDIAVLQLADMPGRIEAGGGEIDFVPLLAHAMRKGYEGLVELEHDWSEPGAAKERHAIEQLRAIDFQAQSSAGRDR